MTPCNKIKFEILLTYFQQENLNLPSGFLELETDEEIDSVYNKNYDKLPSKAIRLKNYDRLQDLENEFREGDCETNIPTEWDRNYESKSVAKQMSDGSWVGWTYWYGGGKHGNPEELEWMEYAYDLNCSEETKMIVVKTFTKV